MKNPQDLETAECFEDEYNGFRPHSSLSGLTPNEVVQQHAHGPNFYFRPVAKWEELIFAKLILLFGAEGGLYRNTLFLLFLLRIFDFLRQTAIHGFRTVRTLSTVSTVSTQLYLSCSQTFDKLDPLYRQLNYRIVWRDRRVLPGVIKRSVIAEWTVPLRIAIGLQHQIPNLYPGKIVLSESVGYRSSVRSVSSRVCPSYHRHLFCSPLQSHFSPA